MSTRVSTSLVLLIQMTLSPQHLPCPLIFDPQVVEVRYLSQEDDRLLLVKNAMGLFPALQRDG
jgi:hypothetical protein